MLKRQIAHLILCACLFGLPACQAGGGGQGFDPASSKPSATLENTRWKLLEVGGKPAVVHPHAPEASITLMVAEHRVQGSSGCNNLMGGYELDGDRLKFGQVAMTRKACIGPLGDQEMAFTQAINQTARWEIQGETLQLLDDKGATLARFEALYLR